MGLLTTAQNMAGTYYAADLYNCQRCVDPHMSMVSSGTTFSCVCNAGYTLVGVPGIGPQSCVLTTLTVAHSQEVFAASQVTYYDKSVAGEGNFMCCKYSCVYVILFLCFIR